MAETLPDRIGGDLALADLQAVVRGALATNGSLLTAGELFRASQILGLAGPAGRIYARLAGRRGDVFRADQLAYHDVEQGLGELLRLGLIHAGLPWQRRLACFTVAELKSICRELGLARGGRRDDLVARLEDAQAWSDARIIRLVGKRLVRRLEQLWFRSGWRDRSVMVLERLGQVAPAVYEPTGGGLAFSTRGQLLEYEGARGEDIETALERLPTTLPRPAHLRGLDVHRLRGRRLAEHARELERSGDDVAAEAIFRVLIEQRARLAFSVWRLAQILGRTGRAAEGAALCAEHRDSVGPASALQLERTGRRLARSSRVGWRPARPLQTAPVRTLRMSATQAVGNRPGWDGTTVEAAVSNALAPRRVLFAENLLWTTMLGLLFVDLYFLPVPDMLPVPYLQGPLDLGTPVFRGHRAAAVMARLEAIRAGQAVELVTGAWAAREGQSIAGLSWTSWSREDLLGVAASTPPAALARICERLIDEGWTAAQGLPDLCVLAGSPLRVDGVPASVQAQLLLIEVKGPTDSLRDEQRVWHDELGRAGVRVEVWQVHA